MKKQTSEQRSEKWTESIIEFIKSLKNYSEIESQASVFDEKLDLDEDTLLQFNFLHFSIDLANSHIFNNDDDAFKKLISVISRALYDFVVFFRMKNNKNVETESVLEDMVRLINENTCAKLEILGLIKKEEVKND